MACATLPINESISLKYLSVNCKKTSRQNKNQLDKLKLLSLLSLTLHTAQQLEISFYAAYSFWYANYQSATTSQTTEKFKYIYLIVFTAYVIAAVLGLLLALLLFLFGRQWTGWQICCSRGMFGLGIILLDFTFGKTLLIQLVKCGETTTKCE